jgi:hypothetical protein
MAGGMEPHLGHEQRDITADTRAHPNVEKMHALVDTYRDRAADEDDANAAQVRIHTHAFPLTTE